MKFWILEEPEYESDYQGEYINGYLEHPFGMPGVCCNVCGVSWGGSRILPVMCPSDLRNNKNLIDSWAIPLEKYKELEMEVLRKLKEEGADLDELKTSDTFQPCYLDVPSKPCFDFLWASHSSLVVSERIKNLMLEQCSKDIAVCDVVLRKTGKRDVNIPVQIPSSGEPGDIMDEAPLLQSHAKVGLYFEICVLDESGCPPGGEPKSVCSGCKRPEIDMCRREIRMRNEMWKGNQIFFLATNQYIIVTDELKRKLENMKPTNVIFS